MVGREEDKRFLLALRLLVLKEPDAEWVVDPVRDRDMLTLQMRLARRIAKDVAGSN